MRMHMRMKKPAARIRKALRKAVNLSVRSDLVRAARERGLNLSRVLEDALDLKLRQEQARKWVEDNREAIQTYNERVEREGLWHKGLTAWY